MQVKLKTDWMRGVDEDGNADICKDGAVVEVSASDGANLISAGFAEEMPEEEVPESKAKK